MSEVNADDRRKAEEFAATQASARGIRECVANGYLAGLAAGRAEQREIDAETLGRVVRDAWVKWAGEQPDVVSRPDWLDTWEQLPERIKDADRRIGMAVAATIRSTPTPDDDRANESKPIGTCPKCGTPWYTDEGYCGGCRRG